MTKKVSTRAPINVTAWDGPGPAAPAILVHGTFTWASWAFQHQQPLARDRRVLLPDRRGFGHSPDPDDGISDYAADASDILELMASAGPHGVHLLGHSYGGTVAMLAAAARPDLVRSLTLVEPCAHTVAASSPVVAAAIDDGRRFMAVARDQDPSAYVETAYPVGRRPQPASWLLRAARTALNERPCWLAELPVPALREATFAKLVVLGGWDSTPPGYRPGMAEVMRVVCTTVASRIGARLAEVPGAAHEPQREEPEAFNQLVRDFWASQEGQ
ncbi:alpha/beta hydrolase [Actinoplanes sp. Pm04-4]|uniref:Alpha/beta hydrolase n=1 Tax=Paractinoplanes pyxinae TaxID=2997416 RepID=A0ABT4B6M1_9ACTN|nr:alpha/beta hydrolase [Actinoplanes pyxinae]MCY1142139.1 alpha/beta hydrolase [Actinoplanes pyxinae]